MKFNDRIDNFNIVSSFTENPKYDFGSYAKGYHNAARKLANLFLEQSSFNDCDGYPIVFLYRHSFELYMKNIIYWGIRLTDFKNSTIDSKLYNHHKLVELSFLCCNILKILFPDDSDIHDITKKIRYYADEFSSLDPDSFSYRYPINKSGDYSTNKHQIVSITSLSINMNELLDICEIINFGLDVETCKEVEIINALTYFSEN